MNDRRFPLGLEFSKGSFRGELFIFRGCGLDIHKKTVVAYIIGEVLRLIM